MGFLEKEWTMDGQREKLEEKLSGLLREAAEVSVALDYVDETSPRVPHYIEIEERGARVGPTAEPSDSRAADGRDRRLGEFQRGLSGVRQAV